MFCYIKEWPNKMATLITEDGVVLCTCQNTDEAQQVWRDWKQQQKSKILAASESELQVLPYSPTILDWVKGFISEFYIRKNRMIVSGKNLFSVLGITA